MGMTERTPDDAGRDREPVQPPREPGNAPEREPGTTWETPREERPPVRREGTVSDPDFAGTPPAPDHSTHAEGR
jgi:hypothetical protein